jgi:hypothetical protein
LFRKPGLEGDHRREELERQLSEKIGSVEMMSRPEDEDTDPLAGSRWSWYGGIISAQLASHTGTCHISLDAIRAPRAFIAQSRA